MSRIQSVRVTAEPFSEYRPQVSQARVRPEPVNRRPHLKTAAAVGAISLATASVAIATIRYLSDGDNPQFGAAQKDSAGTLIAADGRLDKATDTSAKPSLSIHDTGEVGGSLPERGFAEDVATRTFSAKDARNRGGVGSSSKAYAEPKPTRSGLNSASAAPPTFSGSGGNSEVRPDMRGRAPAAFLAQRSRGEALEFVSERVASARGPSSAPASSGLAPTPDLSPEVPAVTSRSVATGPDAPSERLTAAGAVPPSSPPQAARSRASDARLVILAAAEEPIIDTTSAMAAPVSRFASSDAMDASLARSERALGSPAPASFPRQSFERVALGRAVSPLAGDERPSLGAPLGTQVGVASSMPLVLPSTETLAPGSYARLAAADLDRPRAVLPPGAESLANPASVQAIPSFATGRLDEAHQGNPQADLVTRTAPVALPPAKFAATERSTSTDLAERNSTFAPTPLEQSPAPPAFSGTLSENDRVLFSAGGRAEQGGLAMPETLRLSTISIGSGGEETPLRYGESVSRQGARGNGAIDSIPLAQTPDGTVSVRLEDLISLLEKKMERPLFVWLKSSGSASKYVTFETLRAAGIEVEYDPATNHLVLSASEAER